MITERTDITNIGSGIIFYDGGCGICTASAGRFHQLLERRGFLLMPLQSPQAQSLTGASSDEFLKELHVLTPTRQLLRGADAIVFIMRRFRRLAPIRLIAKLPGVMFIIRKLYALLARHRHRVSSACSISFAKGA